MLLPHLVAQGLPVAMQPQDTRGAWWESKEVRCAVHALRLVRSTDDSGAARVLRLHGDRQTLRHQVGQQHLRLLLRADEDRDGGGRLA